MTRCFAALAREERTPQQVQLWESDAHVTEPSLALSALEVSQMFFPWWQSRKKIAEVPTPACRQGQPWVNIYRRLRGTACVWAAAIQRRLQISGFVTARTLRRAVAVVEMLEARRGSLSNLGESDSELSLCFRWQATLWQSGKRGARQENNSIFIDANFKREQSNTAHLKVMEMFLQKTHYNSKRSGLQTSQGISRGRSFIIKNKTNRRENNDLLLFGWSSFLATLIENNSNSKKTKPNHLVGWCVVVVLAR